MSVARRKTTPKKAAPRRGGPRVTLEPHQGETKRAVLKGLRAYNRAKTGRKDHTQVTLSLRDASDAVVGGLIAEVYWDWMFVRLFWIDEGHRGQGHGERLLRQAEDEARRCGVANVYLDTMSFQAPEFYRKQGYQEFGRLDDFPRGHRRFWLSKAL